MGKRQGKRRVAVITGTRAEYGFLAPVMSAIAKHPRLELQLVVTGMHLLRRFGYTVREIERDGWRIDARVRLQGEADDVIGQSRGLGRAIVGMTEAFARLRTEVVLVLGDRLEMLAGAAAATASQLVLGHIHGGDAAPGVQDDAYRHAITKLAHVHFAASAGSRRRLERLGEETWRIYQTGSPGLDNLSDNICRDAKELSGWAGFDVEEDFLLVIEHPAGGTAKQEERRMRGTLAACRCKGLQVLVLYPNCDRGFSGIIRAARQVCAGEGWGLVRHVPRRVYLGLLSRARVLVGNSSSGLIEGGFLNVDVINVGPRQQGRERGGDVRDVEYGRGAVAEAIDDVLRQRPSRRRPCRIYGDGHSSKRIASILAQVRLTERLRQKVNAY